MNFQAQGPIGDISTQATIAALNETVELECNGISGAKSVISGTWVGTIKFQKSIDGTRWDDAATFDLITGANLTTSGVTANTIVGHVGVAGVYKVRAIFTSYTSGSATVALRGSVGASHVLANNLTAANLKNTSFTSDGSGNAITSTTVSAKRGMDCNLIGGTINVIPVGTLATYSAAVSLLNVTSSPTDIFLIKGSASKIVKINRLFFSGTQNNASTIDLLLVKRTADNTAGTRSSITAVSHDSTDAAATVQVFSYTANASALGTSAGTIRAVSVNIPNKNSVGSITSAILELSQPPQKSIILNNANEYLAINLNAVSIAGSSLNITVDWTEE